MFSRSLATLFAISVMGVSTGEVYAQARLVVNPPLVASPPPLSPTSPAADWKNATSATLTWDVQHQRPASQPTTARIATDSQFLYIRFDAPQREPIAATQKTNDIGNGTDDEVWIDLWPNGNLGFFYEFLSTPIGTHYQSSSENTTYAPTWESFGTTTPTGFTVTMRIPLRVIRISSGSSGWKVQFARIIRSTGERQIWSYQPAQTDPDDVAYAGDFTITLLTKAPRAQARVAIYGLAAVGRPALTTTRTGADVSVPITSTASLYATFHPDFSNVEVDQQSIAPTAYPRNLSEVRPFFSQGAGYFGNTTCFACPFIRELYTRRIPTPSDGYAIEGKQGPFSFAAFDALGLGRGDGAAALTYRSKNNYWRYTVQNVVANGPGRTDHTTSAGFRFYDSKHWLGYFTYSNDSGTNVAVGNRAQRYDGGLAYSTRTFSSSFTMRKVGQYYSPGDGFVPHTDIAGWSSYHNKVWLFSKSSALNSIQLGAFFDRYHDHTGALDQTDNSIWLDVLTRNLIDVNINLGSSYLLLDSGVFAPVTQNSIGIMYHSGSSNDPASNEDHGASATPTSISFSTGRFGPGRVNSWYRSSTMRIGARTTLILEADDTRDHLDSDTVNVQWLERLAYAYATGPNSSFAVGVRRIIGTELQLDAEHPPVFAQAWNVSFAFHKRTPHDELYFAYGDASQFTTVPQWIFKFIPYFGAEKGT